MGSDDRMGYPIVLHHITLLLNILMVQSDFSGPRLSPWTEPCLPCWSSHLPLFLFTHPTVILALRFFYEDSNYVLTICPLSLPFPKIGITSFRCQHGLFIQFSQRSLLWYRAGRAPTLFLLTLLHVPPNSSLLDIITQFGSREHSRYFKWENFNRGNICI